MDVNYYVSTKEYAKLNLIRIETFLKKSHTSVNSGQLVYFQYGWDGINKSGFTQRVKKPNEAEEFPVFNDFTQLLVFCYLLALYFRINNPEMAKLLLPRMAQANVFFYPVLTKISAGV